MAGIKQATRSIDTTIRTNLSNDPNNAPLYSGVPAPSTENTSSINFNLESNGEDLKLWLEFTRFYDTEYRNKILQRLRHLRLLDEQRSQIVSELHSASGGLPFTTALSPTLLSPLSPLEQQQRHGSSHSIISSAASPIIAQASHKASQAGEVTGGASSHLFASSSSAITTTTAPSEITASSDETGADSSALPSLPRHGDRYSVVSTSESMPSAGDDAEVESNPDKIPRYKLPGHLSSMWNLPSLHDPDRIQESRYFLIKSFNAKNVEMSQKDGLWVTKEENGQLLTDAFNKSQNVYLFYSVNKSRCFQGYARMLTAPSSDIEKGKWMSNIHWKTSPPFRVEWINTRSTEFWELSKLRNDFDDGQKIFVGRDGLEYSESCGSKLMAIMDNPPVAIGVKKREKWWGAKLRTWNDEPDAGGGQAWEGIDEAEAVDCSNWRSARPESRSAVTDGGNADGEDQNDMNLIDY